MVEQAPKYISKADVKLKGSPGFHLDELSCPICEETNLHQKKIEVFDREEDEEAGFHVTVDNKTVSVDENMNDNPSGRRQGLMIYFKCEHCDGIPKEFKEVEFSCRLVIYQHKGCTYMHMESV